MSSKFYPEPSGGINRLSEPIVAMMDWSLSKADSQSFNLNWTKLFFLGPPVSELATEPKVVEYLVRYLKDFGHEPAAYSAIDSGINLAARLQEAKRSRLPLDSMLKQVLERIETLPLAERERAVKGLHQYQMHLDFRKTHADFAPTRDSRSDLNAFVAAQDCRIANAKVAAKK